LGDPGWLAITPEGFFDASSEEFAASMISIVRGLKVSAVDAAAYQVLHRPDLVARQARRRSRWQGQGSRRRAPGQAGNEVTAKTGLGSDKSRSPWQFEEFVR
jgi:hypothetical protein